MGSDRRSAAVEDAGQRPPGQPGNPGQPRRPARAGPWIIALVSAVGLAAGLIAPAWAQPADLTVEQVAHAAETHDAVTLKRAFEDPVFLPRIAADEAQAAIDLKVSIADGLAGAGDPQAALVVMQSALADMARVNGANDPQQIGLLRRSAALRSRCGDLAGAAQDLDRAKAVATADLDGDSLELTAVQAEDNDAWRAYLAAVPTAKRPLQFSSRGVADQQFDSVEIYYATHRKATGSAIPARAYGAERGPLVFGKAHVSVPRNRAPGAIPVPSLWRLEFRADPEKHVILTDVQPMISREAFFADLSGKVGASNRKEVFVFIHGFNATFEQAALRTAQLAADLSIDGAPILYSWPSRGSALGYRADSAEADLDSQVDDLAQFLADVAQRTGAARVHLVAHSLGNKFLTKALTRLAERPVATRPEFDEIVMAAPDVAADDFRGRWQAIRPLAHRFTVYASRRDFALLMSDTYNHANRLGDARNLVVLDGMQTVDTTEAKSGLLGHADFDGNALDDFRGLIWDSLAPGKRCVLQAEVADGRPYWVFAAGSKKACTDGEFREVVSLVRRTGSPANALAELKALPAKPDVLQKLELAGLSLDQLRRRLLETYGLVPAP